MKPWSITSCGATPSTQKFGPNRTPMNSSAFSKVLVNGKEHMVSPNNAFLAQKPFVSSDTRTPHKICVRNNVHNVVCKYRPQKEDPYRTIIVIGGNRICYPGDVGTPTGSLDIVKLVINRVLSRRNVSFACFDVKNLPRNTDGQARIFPN